MFIAGAVVVGGVIIGGASYDDEHHRYRDHSNHSRYGDAEMRRNIEKHEARVNRKKNEVQRLFNEYHNLPEYNLDKAKADMKRELENEIQRDKQELAEVNKMLSKINELELQSRR